MLKTATYNSGARNRACALRLIVLVEFVVIVQIDLRIRTLCFARSKLGYTPAVPQTPAPGTDGRLRHVVMFRFRSDAPPGSVQKVEEGFKKLASEIEEIKSFEWGCNNSIEPLGEGYSHVFLVTFEDSAGRATYLPHPVRLLITINLFHFMTDYACADCLLT